VDEDIQRRSNVLICCKIVSLCRLSILHSFFTCGVGCSVGLQGDAGICPSTHNFRDPEVYVFLRAVLICLCDLI
jgi:hypothetical protein